MRGENTTTDAIKEWYMNFEQLIAEITKAHSAKAVVSLFGAFLFLHILPIAHFLAIGTLLVVSDWVTGVWAAIKRKEKITSKGLRRTVEKVVMYSLAIVLVLVVETAFLGTHYVVAAVALYISMVELFSNLENISSITDSNIIGATRTVLFARFPMLKSLMTTEKKSDKEE